MLAPQSVIDFFMAVLQDNDLKEQFQSAIAREDTRTLLKLAKERGLDFTANELRQGLKQIQNILPSPHQLDNLTLSEYRCTRNTSYTGNCRGRDDVTARQGYYIYAHSEEEAWQIMATRYPDETEAGFSIQDWSEHSGKSVVVLRAERDEDGSEILINQEGLKAITNDEGDVIGYED